MLRMVWVGSLDKIWLRPEVLEEVGRESRAWNEYWVRDRILIRVAANVSLLSMFRERVRLSKGEYLLCYVLMDEYRRGPTYKIKRVSNVWAARMCEIYQWPHEVELPEPDAKPEVEDMGSATGKQSDGLSLESMRPSWRMAWLALEDAQSAKGTQLTYEQAWDWLKLHGSDGYELPAIRNFCDYCSKAAKRLNEQRKKPRAGRDGRSIVKPSEL